MLIPAHLRVHESDGSHNRKQSARKHATFKAYVALYHAGLLNDHLLPLSDSIVPPKEAELQELLQDVAKRDGLASVRKEISPWYSSAIPRTDEWWLNYITIEAVGTMKMLTCVELPPLDFPIVYMILSMDGENLLSNHLEPS